MFQRTKSNIPLTEGQRSELIRRYEAQESTATLASDYGYDENTLRYWLRLLGVQIRPRGGRRAR